MILYWPSVSVITERTRSMSAGLDASTVTPGITAPDASFTTPAMPPAACAAANDGSSNAARTARQTVADLFIETSRPTAEMGSHYRLGLQSAFPEQMLESA